MIRVAVNGAAGRMGRMVMRLVSEADDCQLVSALERAGHPALGSDAGVLAGVGELGLPLSSEMEGNPDVLVDFSAPDASVARALACASGGVALVIGTTGHSKSQLEQIEQEAASKVPVLLSPNMSPGVNLLFRLVGDVARVLGSGYDIEIIEAHHRRKKDAPSGTASKLAQIICDALGWDRDKVLTYGREGITGERPSEQIAVHAIRGGDIAGFHTVLFAGEGEQVELTHRAENRDVLARGALRALRFVVKQPPGLYTVADTLSQ